MQLIRHFIEQPKPAPIGLAKKTFQAEFSVCKTHGQFAVNTQDTAGIVRWTNGLCPTCQKNERAKKLFDQAGFGKKYENARFENFDAITPKQQQIKKLCWQYAKNFELALEKGQSLMLCGQTGTGKNHLAAAICHEIMQKNYAALLIKATHFLDAYWAKSFEERQNWLQAIATVDLFILDELGKTSQAKSAQDAFFRLIDARYENCRPTILTTNLNREGLIEVLGDAAFDRLTEGSGMRLTLNWASFRSHKLLGDKG
jgi:DNA replication protein DnaC